MEITAQPQREWEICTVPLRAMHTARARGGFAQNWGRFEQKTRGSGKKNRCGCSIKKISFYLFTKNVLLLFPSFYLYICIGRYGLWVSFKNQFRQCHRIGVGRVTRFCLPASALSVGPKFGAVWLVRLGFVGEVRSLLTCIYPLNCRPHKALIM